MNGKKGSGKPKNNHGMSSPRITRGMGKKVSNPGKSVSVTAKKGNTRKVSVRSKRGA